MFRLLMPRLAGAVCPAADGLPIKLAKALHAIALWVPSYGGNCTASARGPVPRHRQIAWRRYHGALRQRMAGAIHKGSWDGTLPSEIGTPVHASALGYRPVRKLAAFGFAFHGRCA